MRYEKADNLLILALEMQAARSGWSLQDIQERFGVGRRTAMRMRDAIMRIFPQADEVIVDGRTKRWRIPAGTLNKLVDFSADELADLETAVRILQRDNMEDQARSLENLLAKLKAGMKPEVSRRVEPDLEALLEAENLAMRPGPRPRNRTFVLEQLRSAIKGCQVVTIKYKTRSTGKVSQRKVQPYGFLYGHRHYLVAYNLRKAEEGTRVFSLPNIHKVEVTDEYFERDEEFDLDTFARASFGVFHDEPVDVVWKFSPRAAADARDFIFHPDQTLEPQSDGSLIVKFRAGGQLEMCWHLYAWGEDVEVIAPETLALMCLGHRPRWPGLP
ncbi:MAG: WYL domain-containing protein [Proteobacteria bacterium]|nr:WYL domain-containing protein [Pseudomonadota bacterium]